MPSSRLWAALFFLSISSACGGKSAGAGEPNGGTDAGGTEAGGTEAGGTEAGGTEAGGTGVGGTGAGGAIGGTGIGGTDPECKRFDDEAPVYIPIEIVNETASAIHLGPTTQGCETVPLFTVADAAGETLPALSWCRFSCQSLHEQGGAGCPAICPIWDTITLQPGETTYTMWDGRYRAEGMLRSHCVLGEEPGHELMCDQAKTIRPGRFQFAAQAGTGLECALSSMCPACRPNEQGGCKTSGTLVSGAMREAFADVQLDAGFGVLELPAPPRDAPGGAAPEPQPVRIVFRD